MSVPAQNGLESTAPLGGDIAVVRKALSPVRQRQRLVLMAETTAWGLLAGAGAGLVAAAIRLATTSETSLAVVLGIVGFGAAVGAVSGACWRRGWELAARAIDRHYGLKDRALSALAFTAAGASDPVRTLAVGDALAALRGVDAKAVVPLRMPRPLPWALGLMLLAGVVAMLPLASRPVEAAPTEPLPEVVAEAEVIAEELERMQEAVKELEHPEIKELLAQLEAQAQELKEPGVDTKEALAKLSEMQAALAAQMAELSTTQTDAQLAAIGEALSSAEQLRPAGQAMAAGEHEKAAELLNALDELKLDAKEGKAVSEKLASASGLNTGKMSKSLADALNELKKDCEACNSSSSGLKKLAGECNGQCQKKKIKDLLQSCCNCLSECKSNCNKNSTKKGKQRKKSNSPSQSWGMGESGNIDGERTNLNGNRREEQLTGQAGEGPSETETTHEVEGNEQAQRSYKEQFSKYQRMSESVLESEPIPLGHRQTIRNYFERIRPANDELAPANGDRAE
jgi:hypothetical protein